MPDEGYVFARSDYPETPGAPWWYFAQTASFHSRVHKHADDLSFVWSDRGLPILVDPARFAYSGKTERGSDLAKQGFWYADPKRIYVESTRAHNTVEIDGRSYNRTRTPYSSALRYAGEQDGLIVTECHHRPAGTVLHIRLLTLAPGRFLLVVDWLFDRSGTAHDFRQHVHFHPDWHVVPDPADETGTRLLAEHGKTSTASPSCRSWPSKAPSARFAVRRNRTGWAGCQTGPIASSPAPASSLNSSPPTMPCSPHSSPSPPMLAPHRL